LTRFDGAAPDATTVGVGDETAVAFPPLFVAVTETLKRWPTSSSVSVYCRRWIPMFEQFAAFVSQRIQLYE
jgi:hypothetical protein